MWSTHFKGIGFTWNLSSQIRVLKFSELMGLVGVWNLTSTNFWYAYHVLIMGLEVDGRCIKNHTLSKISILIKTRKNLKDQTRDSIKKLQRKYQKMKFNRFIVLCVTPRLGNQCQLKLCCLWRNRKANPKTSLSPIILLLSEYVVEVTLKSVKHVREE